jgi:signal peptidase I
VAKGRRRRLKPVNLWKEVPLLLGVALLLALFIKTFVVQAYYIPSQSMQYTINPGDRVLINKLSPWFDWTPQRGEVVVFKDPGNWLDPAALKKDNAVVSAVKSAFSFVGLLPSGSEQDLIKRVVGVPGDEVACKGAGAPVTVNGVPLSEKSYLFTGDVPSQQVFDVKVRPNMVFVLGDHRSDSGDSRVHLSDRYGGMVPYSDIQGHAFVRIWPFSRIGGIGTPGTFQLKGGPGSAGPVVTTAAQALAGAPALWGLALAVPLRAWWLRRRRGGSVGSLEALPTAAGVRTGGAARPAVRGVTKRLRERLGTGRQRG